MISPIAQKLEIEYPESDGEPMGETETHIYQLFNYLLAPLIARYRNSQNVYVMGNIFLYYEEGNPAAVVSPDAFVVFGVSKFDKSNETRRIYKLWEEGKAPDVIFELTSKKTYRADMTDKRFLYEELGVKEYFLFDPLHEYLRPPLQGFRLVDGYYLPLAAEQVSLDVWELESEQLGLILRVVNNNLRFYDPQNEQYLLSASEENEARLMAEEKLAESKAEIARLRKLLGESDMEG